MLFLILIPVCCILLHVCALIKCLILFEVLQTENKQGPIVMRLRKKGAMWSVCENSTTQPDNPKMNHNTNIKENGRTTTHYKWTALSGPCVKAKGRTIMYSGRKRGMYQHSIAIVSK